jgi:hypothetical protein
MEVTQVSQRTIALPADLCIEAEKWMAGRFGSLEELVTFLLREIVQDEDDKIDQQEEELIQQRLRDLGYI